MYISDEKDRKRRERMVTTILWSTPQKMFNQIFKDGDDKIIERGRDSKEKKIQKERIEDVFDANSIGGERLKDPKSLTSNRQTPPSNNNNPLSIPLESEVN